VLSQKERGLGLRLPFLVPHLDLLGFNQQNVLKATFQGMTRLPLEVSPCRCHLPRTRSIFYDLVRYVNSFVSEATHRTFAFSERILKGFTFQYILNSSSCFIFWEYFTCWLKIEIEFLMYILKRLKQHLLVSLCPLVHLSYVRAHSTRYTLVASWYHRRTFSYYSSNFFPMPFGIRFPSILLTFSRSIFPLYENPSVSTILLICNSFL
jgi:hypothetical protein